MTFSHLTSLKFYRALEQAGGEVYLVGGPVRDTLLGLQVKDIDLLVRKIPIKKLEILLREFGKVSSVGKSFGILKFISAEKPEIEIDIALPRKEKSTGSGHCDFTVDYDPDLNLAEDLYRRDFTINAMAMNLTTGQLIDPYGGKQDLEKKLLRAVFDQAFIEDPLRLLRAIQFSARLSLKIENKTLNLMREAKELIRTVARERIILEIGKMFTAKKPSLGFDLMQEIGLLEIIFPEIASMRGVIQPQKNNEDVYTHTMKVLDASRSASELEKAGNLEIMFSALFHDAGKPITHRINPEDGRVTFYNHQIVSTKIAKRWLRDFRATTIGVDPEKVCHLVRHHMFETTAFKDNEKAIRRFINKVGPEHIYDLLDLRLADKKGGKFPKKVWGILNLREKIRAELEKEPPLMPRDLQLKGDDFMKMGLKGPEIGLMQSFLLKLVVDSPERNSLPILTELVEKHLDDVKSITTQTPDKYERLDKISLLAHPYETIGPEEEDENPADILEKSFPS